VKDLRVSLVVQAAGVADHQKLAEVLAGRSNILELTDSSHDAALRPDPPGGISHAERAALACRMARLNDEPVLAQHFEGMIGDGSNPARSIADPGFQEAEGPRLRAIIRHTDLVAVNPKEATGADIAALKAAGVSEDDIVRLSELIAFVSYLIRVVVGLRLMAEVV
jgi:uncharacterized protein YciW